MRSIDKCSATDRVGFQTVPCEKAERRQEYHLATKRFRDTLKWGLHLTGGSSMNLNCFRSRDQIRMTRCCVHVLKDHTS